MGVLQGGGEDIFGVLGTTAALPSELTGSGRLLFWAGFLGVPHHSLGCSHLSLPKNKDNNESHGSPALGLSRCLVGI